MPRAEETSSWSALLSERKPANGRTWKCNMTEIEFAELRSLLDALCEESISAEQVRRLEELVLSHPDAGG